MMNKASIALCALLAFSGLFYIGCRSGKSYDEVNAYMQSEDYKAQEAAHFAKLARMEAAR